jgi:hypothetical protein
MLDAASFLYFREIFSIPIRRIELHTVRAWPVPQFCDIQSARHNFLPDRHGCRNTCRVADSHAVAHTLPRGGAHVRSRYTPSGHQQAVHFLRHDSPVGTSGISILCKCRPPVLCFTSMPDAGGRYRPIFGPPDGGTIHPPLFKCKRYLGCVSRGRHCLNRPEGAYYTIEVSNLLASGVARIDDI